MLELNIKLVLTSTLVVLIVSLLAYIAKGYKYWERRGVPYIKPWLFIGNLSFLMRKSTYQYFNELRKQYPTTSYFGIFLGRQPALVVQTPELTRKILVKDADHFQDRYTFANRKTDPLGSLNLFTVKNPIWSNMRHELSPMFTSSRLRGVTELMNMNAKELVLKVRRDYIEGKREVNLKELFSMYTSDTVGYTVFGLRVSSLSGQDSPLWAITSHMVKWTFRRGFDFTMIFFMPFVAKLMRLSFFSPEATKYIKDLFWQVVKLRKDFKETNSRDLVNHLLKLKDNLKLPADADSELADNLMLAQAAVFILGSIETSSTTLSYCLHELAHHPDIQEKLYNEVNDALTRSGKEILEYDDLMELKFLSSCIFETMRVHTPLPFLDRICGKTYDLDGVTIEKGVPVLINVMALHRDPKVYPDPDHWNPSRSAVATSDSDNLGFSFLPFGDGPRFCIGKRYGMMQIRAALAQLIMSYRVEPGPVPYEVEPDPYSVILAPKDGGTIKFVPR